MGVPAQLNLFDNKLGAEEAKALAPAIAGSSSLTQLDLSSNELCGLNMLGEGTYDNTGITALAGALGACGSLTEVRALSPASRLQCVLLTSNPLVCTAQPNGEQPSGRGSKSTSTRNRG